MAGRAPSLLPAADPAGHRCPPPRCAGAVPAVAEAATTAEGGTPTTPLAGGRAATVFTAASPRSVLSWLAASAAPCPAVLLPALPPATTRRPKPAPLGCSQSINVIPRPRRGGAPPPLPLPCPPWPPLPRITSPALRLRVVVSPVDGSTVAPPRRRSDRCSVLSFWRL